MRSLIGRFIGLGLAALAIGACQRTIIQLPTEATVPVGLTTPEIERSAHVAESQGTVEARATAQEPWRAAGPELMLSEGSQVRTASGSRALVQLTEGSRIRLGPATAFTFNILNPYLENHLTSLALENGEVWVLLIDGALDVETPLGIASARTAYMSVNYDAGRQTVSVSCLQGTCSFGSLFIPSGHKLARAEDAQASPEPMAAADYGQWGVAVPEATQLAFYATEALAQGSATLPVIPTDTPTAPLAATAAPFTSTPQPQPPTATVAGPAATAISVAPTLTPVRPTPAPAVPIIGRHVVQGGETIFCIGRGYGVLPAAIAEANGLRQPFTVFPGQSLRIPAVQWRTILPGPVCATQFRSPYPGLPAASPTSAVGLTPTSALPRLSAVVNILCIGNCGSRDGSYVLRIYVDAVGGMPPYTYTPGREFDVTFPHCTTGTGTVTITSGDGQSAATGWSYVDPSCPSGP